MTNYKELFRLIISENVHLLSYGSEKTFKSMPLFKTVDDKCMSSKIVSPLKEQKNPHGSQDGE